MTPIKPRRRTPEEKHVERSPKKDKRYPNIHNPEAVLRDIQRSWIEHDGPPPPSRISDHSILELQELTSALPREERLAYLDKLSAQPSTKEAEAAPGELRGQLLPEDLPDPGVQCGELQPAPEDEADAGDRGPPGVRAPLRDVLVARGEEAARRRVAEGGQQAEAGPGDLPATGGGVRDDVHPGEPGGDVRPTEEGRRPGLTEEMDWLLG